MSSLSSLGGTSSAASSTPSSTSATGTLSVGGLISGLNTSQIIQGLLAVQQSQITAVQNQQSAVTQREGAYKALEAQLLNLQSSTTQLSQPVNGPFDGRTATSSDQTVLTAAASSDAAAGTYSLTVNTLAQANQVASQNFDSTSSKITHGTLTVGSGSSTATITIDGTNDTLQGLASAINGANAGVSATVINDGSSHPYRLLLTANNTGVANAVTFDPSGLAPDDATSGAVRPTITSTVQAATDASVTLGSGSGAVTVTSASNTVNNVIAGVTLNLVAANPSKPVQVAVASDTATAQKAVQDFVTAYNSVISTIDSDVQYDPQSNTAGVLLGDPSIVGIEDQLRNLATGVVPGANPKLSSLSALGITSDASGQLQINSGQLNKVLSGQVSGVTLADVRRLFAPSGQSTNPGVIFVNATSATKSSASPYGVDITQAAGQATLTANTAPTLPVTAGNNSFTIVVDGITSGTITVPPGDSYTATSLAAAIQAQIAADSKVGGEGVTVGVDAGGHLTFTSGKYGSGSSVSLGPVGFLGVTTAAQAVGRDVAGSFLVNGVSEPATGSGQLLTGQSGNANTDGLAVRVTLTDADVSAAAGTPEANVSVGQGLAAQLGSALNGLLDPTTGRLQTIDQNFQDQITGYQKTIDLLQQEYNTRQTQLTEEFVNLETTLNTLKTASSFLTAQSSALAAFSGAGSSGGASSSK